MSLDESAHTQSSPSRIQQLGEKGERALNDWLQKNGLSFVHITQSEQTFAPLFRNAVKRPDFLVLLEAIGILAVDVKNYTLFENSFFSLNIEHELRKTIAFERLFRLPVWYVYMNRQEEGVWYWISALKALEVGDVRRKGRTGEEFLIIRLEEFVRVTCNDDLAGLYTLRLPSATRLPVEELRLNANLADKYSITRKNPGRRKKSK